MTEVAAEIPAQRADSDATTIDATPADPAAPDGAVAVPVAEAQVVDARPVETEPTSTYDRVQDRVQDFAGDVADRVGDVAERTAAASGRIAAQVVDRLRNNAELAAERGTTTIANEVVEKIAGIAAREVPGVYDLGGDVARVFAAVKERVGLGDADADQGVSVRLDGKTAAVKVVIVIEYGFVVYSVTEKVRAKVISAVENLLGLEVTAVDIVVDDVHVDDSGPVGDDEKRAAGYEAS
jgi:uncharacterized alkaline shock family protein YloU